MTKQEREPQEENSESAPYAHPEYLQEMIKDLEKSEKQKVPDGLKAETDAKNQKKREQIEVEKKYLYGNESVNIRTRDREEFYAIESQRQEVKELEASLGATLYTLMRRTNDNPEIVKGVNEFLRALSHQAHCPVPRKLDTQYVLVVS